MSEIGLVLSGGMAKGAYQLGALLALKKQPYAVKAISGSSIGAWNAYAFAAGKLEQAEKLWKELDFPSFRQIITSGRCDAVIRENVCALVADNDHFDMPVYISVLNIRKKKIEYIRLNEMDLYRRREIMRASIALPPLLSRIQVGSEVYCDGAMVDNVPIAPLKHYRLDMIIAMYFGGEGYDGKNQNDFNKVFGMCLGGDGLIRDSICFRHQAIETMIAAGYRQAEEHLKWGKPGMPRLHNADAWVGRLNSALQRVIPCEKPNR